MEAATSDAQHAEMLERINQFNILRESNATLRTDCETYAKRSRELDAKLQALSAELEPAKEQARLAQAELQARDEQITRLEGESRRWQERNAQLLSKVRARSHFFFLQADVTFGSMIVLILQRFKLSKTKSKR